MFGSLFDDFFGGYRNQYPQRTRPQTGYGYAPRRGSIYSGDEDSESDQYGQQYGRQQSYTQPQRDQFYARQQAQAEAQRRAEAEQRAKEEARLKAEAEARQREEQELAQQRQRQRQQMVQQRGAQHKAKRQEPHQAAQQFKSAARTEPVSRNVAQDAAARRASYCAQEEAEQKARTQMFTESALGGGQAFRTAGPAAQPEDAAVHPRDDISARFLFRVPGGYEVRIPQHMVSGVQIAANRRGILTLNAELSDAYVRQVQTFQRHLTLTFQLPNYYDRADILARKENDQYVVHVPLNDNAGDDEMVIGIA